MNKKLITLAVAAAFAPAVAMADATVYGKVHMSMDSNSGYTATAASKPNGTVIANNSSRLGVKGSEDLGNGLTALYQIETSVTLGSNSAAANQFGSARDSYIGLAGGFGAMLVGRLPLANQYAYDVNFFADQVGDAGNFVAANGGSSRVSNAIAYASPAMSGFSALVAYVPNTTDSLAGVTGVSANTPTRQSSYTLRGAYAGGPVNVGLSYQSIDVVSGLEPSKVTALGGTYDFGMGKVGLQYVHNSNPITATAAGVLIRATAAGAASQSQNIYTLGGSFNVGGNGAVKAQYSHAGDYGAVVNTGANMIAVGYDYNFSKRTTGYVAYARASNDAAAQFVANGYGHGGVTGTPGVGQDPSALSIGLAHSF